jgi:hypothetical protein
MDDVREILLKGCEADTFFEVLSEEYFKDRKDEKLLPSILSQLHNEGSLDLIKLFMRLENASNNHDFFSIRHVFEEVLPLIKAPIGEVADCVKHLTLEAGADMAANMLMAPFKEFCKKNAERPKQLLDMALTDIDEEFDHLATALESGALMNESLYVNKGIELLGHDNELVRQRATFALGRIKYVDQALLKNSALTIKQTSQNSSSDTLLATSMTAILSIVLQSPDLECHFIEFIEDHINYFGERYVHAASGILFYENGKIAENIESLLLDICCHTNPENKGTINNIDYALERLVKREKFDTCIIFLEQFFELSDYKTSVKSFNSFVRVIQQHKETYLSSLVTKWLTSKNFKLGIFCSDLLKDSDKGICLSFDTSALGNKNDGVHQFLARKACGWFFTQPKTAISLIGSLIGSAPKEELKEIQKIVFNPLLISYPGSVKTHLELLLDSKNKKTSQLAKAVLSQFDDYQNNLKATSGISELRPSEQERHAYWKHHSKIMDDSMKKARGKSVLSSLFMGNESVLLYGNKSIYYVHHGDEKTRQEMPLQKFSHSIEVASMINLDPHGLDNMLWQFKAEGCNS